MDKDTLLTSFVKLVAYFQSVTNLDRYVKKLDTLVFCSFSLKLNSISASQLSRKNHKLEPEILQEILCGLITNSSS